MSRTTTSWIVVAALVAALIGTFAIAGADEPADTRTTTIGYYIRGKAYVCTGDILCFHPDVVVRCKAGDFATGGAAWMTDHPSTLKEDYLARPWRKNGAARGWMIDTGGSIGPDDRLDVQVICAKQG